MPDTAPTVPHNVILIGFMGSGKSTVGREVASGLSFEFVDTDELIESRSGQTISQIFADKGESAFRDLESEVLASLAARSGLVISTGGGIILDPANRALLEKLGCIVWLDAPEDIIVERVTRNRKRPLVQTDDPRETVTRLLGQRRPLYSETAHLVVVTKGLEIHEIAHGIVESAQVHFSPDQS